MLRKSKSISQIYAETKHYDLVITNDAPLATALNKLVEVPRLDYFAMTPRQIASKFALLNFSKLYSRADIILEVLRKTGKPLKIIHQSIEKIFDVWNNTGLLESCNMHLGDEIEFLKFMEKFKSVEYAMENFNEDFYEGKSIAAAGLNLFNELDKQVLPKRGKTADVIELFDNDESKNSIEKTYLFSGSNDIINQTIDLITPDNETETAIILNTESKYLEVIKSRLISKGINLQIKSYLSEDITTCNILSFMESALSLQELKVSEALFLEAFLGIQLDRKYNQYHFAQYIKNNKKLASLQRAFEIMSETNSYTFGELIDVLNKSFQVKPREEFVKLINVLELKDKPVSVESLNLLKYFISNIDMELERYDKGVLLVNSLNSAFVDRELVFFLGMDESWCRLNPDKPYVEKDKEEEKNLSKFQILLTQGVHKYYMALDSKSSSGFIPCYYFNILADKGIESFENAFFNPVNTGYTKSGGEKNYIKDKIVADKIEDVKTISQSDLNNYYLCPKKYAYSKLTESEKKTHFTKGNLLHAFAEFYFHYPEEASKNFDSILEEMVIQYKVFFKEGNMSAERTEFAVGMKAIMKFIDSKLFVKNKPEDTIEKNDNFLFDMFGKEKIYSNTERKFENQNSGIKGKIDLISGRTIVDYKTGRQNKTDSTLIKEFKPHLLTETNIKDVNFQTPAYIAGQRDNFEKEEIEFLYLQLVESRDQILKGNEIDVKYSYLKYIPKTFKEYILSEDFFNENNTQLLKKVGYDNYKSFMESNLESVDFFDKDSCEMLIENFCKHITNTLGISYTNFKRQKIETFRDKEVKDSLKPVISARKGSFIFKDDIDEFTDLVKRILKEINENIKSDFPNRPALDLRNICRNCDYLNICINNKFWTGVDSEEYS